MNLLVWLSGCDFFSSPHDIDDDGNRMSGAFELDNMDKAPQPSKNKMAGSLFSAKVMDAPRRRSAVGTSESRQ